MNELLQQSKQLTQQVPMAFKRYLADQINWPDRLIGLVGARGTGKTTLLLQWLKSLRLSPNEAAYFSLDDLYFTRNQLKDVATKFYREGGRIIVLDEVHKHENWSRQIKNLYDLYPKLQIIFTGSSIIDLRNKEADLSRRCVMYELPGMSLREFLAIQHGVKLDVISLESLLDPAKQKDIAWPADLLPSVAMKEYLHLGYYPFLRESPKTVRQRMQQLVRQVVEVDMAELAGFDVRHAGKMLRLLQVISEQVPFKPNYEKLAEKAGLSRNSLASYIRFLEKAQLIRSLHPGGNSIATLQKPEKIYLHNTNLAFALAPISPNLGNLRETFFLSQAAVRYDVRAPKKGDFILEQKFTFEVGGAAKTRKQLSGVEQAWVVRDDIDYPVGKELPLWAFGLLY
jgi:predicted AAA+ superfamily ATPase